ncbi:MAG: hypothetical protein J6M66_04460 [Lachnospiraceae bacterium]|nr:hypothetical protein [Lachnospiraceae bacterium]
MKKLIALILGLVMIFSLSATAFAAGEQSGETTLTVEVPEASYTIHIPANMTLEYGNTSEQLIGDYWVSDFVNMPIAAGESEPIVSVKVVGTCLSDGANVIPITYCAKVAGNWDHSLDHKVSSATGSQLTDMVITEDYHGTFGVMVSESDWTAAKPGTYKATMTFNFSIYTGE